MLGPVSGLPRGAIGLRANGTVLTQDVEQAVALAAASSEPEDNKGLIVFIDADFDGYLSELISGLATASQAEAPLFRRWALVMNDDVMSEAQLYGAGSQLQVFPASRRAEALAFACGG